FTRTSAEHFFTRLKQAGVRKLVDVRLNRTSQLAGFAKAGDLAYFTRALCGIETEPMPELAPTSEMLAAYREARAAGAATAWPNYAQAFRRLIGAPHHCHRRIVAEYLREKWDDVQVVDL